MTDPTSNNTRTPASGSAPDHAPAARIPWLALGLAAGALLGAGAGSLAWGLGLGAAIGLGLQQAWSKRAPARR